MQKNIQKPLTRYTDASIIQLTKGKGVFENSLRGTLFFYLFTYGIFLRKARGDAGKRVKKCLFNMIFFRGKR